MRYLFDQTEPVELEFDSEIIAHPTLADGRKVAAGRAGEKLGPLAPGHYLIYENTGDYEPRIRYLGVVGDHTTVMQLTVGAFTADTFDLVAHRYRVPLNYYLNVSQFRESTFRGYEQDYGDAVYPHLMPNQLDFLDPAFHQLSANWDSLSTDEILIRLRKLDEYMQNCGFAPLHGIATYTPGNALIEALKQLNWKVLHSIIPEQNWSDGHWAINHWGMPNQPFYAADDDFRKPTSRSDRNVLEMSMNSYHLYMPHVVHFGDNVLSPSHFLRWHRTVESGGYPERFRNFLIDYLRAAAGMQQPFFLIAGFEFGRTFGVRSMTRHNLRGMELVVELSRTQPIVFATGRDVAAYYEKFCPAAPELVFTQRDYLAGTRIMDKPINSGPSLGMELTDFKAVFAHLELLPYYHYDYLERWSYAADDIDAPADYAAADREAVRVETTDSGLRLTVAAPLVRAVPVALWDALPERELPGIRYDYPPVLDDRRVHATLTLPAGFVGTLEQPLVRKSEPDPAEFAGLKHPLWRVQTIGEGAHRQCYLYLDFQLLQPLRIEWTVPRACRIDALERPLGSFRAGEKVTLEFDSRKTWFRFYGLEASEIQPQPENLPALEEAMAVSRRFFEDGPRNLAAVHADDDAWFAAQLPDSEQVLIEMDCFGNHLFGERSRALKFDRLVRRLNERLDVREYCDGGISLGNGVSFWVHPRGMHCQVTGLDSVEPPRDGVFHLYLFTRTPATEPRLYRYRVWASSADRRIETHTPPWTCPRERSPEAILKFDIPAAEVVNGTLGIGLSADQLGVLDDWFRDGGFIAALERIAVTVSR